MHTVSSALAALDTISILIISVVLLACGSIGLIAVWLTNPRLLGLGWLGISYVSGGTGALLLTLSSHIHIFLVSVFGDFMVLLALVLLHVAILALRRAKDIFPRFGTLLLTTQAIWCLSAAFIFGHGKGRVILIGLLVTAQVVQTVILLLRETKAGARWPAWLSAAILCGLIGTNVFRSVLLLFFHESMNHSRTVALEKIVFLSYLITAIGLGFNFFWMTTAELTSQLEQMASTDPLTRVYNRRVFLEWCEREFLRSQRSSCPFSLLMMDLDHFKDINDRYGHQGGDTMLCAVVEAMQDSIRGIDVLGRWGGEEFVALLPGADADAAVLVAQRVRSRIERMVLPRETMTLLGGREIMRITLSLGVATCRGSNDHLEEMLRRADQALYGAKAAGRNRVLAMV